MDREALINHYARMGDQEFTAFATHEVAGLTPEAVEVVRDELKRRRTVPDPEGAIDVQLRRLSSEEFERMVTAFRQQPCPSCGGVGELLNAARVNRAGRRELIVGCTSCLLRELNRATTASAVYGLAFRPLSAMRAVLGNEGEKAALQETNQTQALREYVWANRGEWAHLLK